MANANPTRKRRASQPECVAGIKQCSRCERDLELAEFNNDGNYEPGNVRWATKKEQAQNRSDTRLITYNGETLCISEWARRLRIDHKTLSSRLKVWPIDRALTTPNLRPCVSPFYR